MTEALPLSFMILIDPQREGNSESLYCKTFSFQLVTPALEEEID
ncbi:673_t:CDS:2 [Dentiscutata heterogama]|uniref:673_t:CDS:1 n=1 Tax=Dentiscutata heterogama TaxID=1316150 RepID=A0ACA9L5Y4_9GLOM|nr:673_t:CDS:2 [Dentiscutata heterogama]